VVVAFWFTMAAVLAAQPVSSDDLVSTARSYLGSPYRYGGTKSNGFDCSGLVQAVYAAHDVALPRTAPDQALMGRAVSRREVAAGDLLFFTNHPGTKRIEHVAIAVDSDMMIHAATGHRHRVVLDPIDTPHYRPLLLFARRIVPVRAVLEPPAMPSPRPPFDQAPWRMRMPLSASAY
jgi:cell wall-associated NlpC family hydrolase